MAISATQIATTNTLENFRQQFNNLQTDVNGLESGTLTFSSVSATTTSTSALNILEDGTIVFEGATDDGNETTLTVADPSADRTITLPDATGTVFLTGTTDSAVITDKANLASADVAGDTDVLLIADVNVTTLKKITPNNLISSAGGLTSLAADSTPQLGGDLDVNGNKITSASNANVEIEPNGTGNILLDSDLITLGSGTEVGHLSTPGTQDIKLSTNSGTDSGTLVITDGANGNITLTPNGTGDVALSADTVVVGDSNADATITSNGTGNLVLNTNSGTDSSALTIVDAANGNIQATLNGTAVFQIDGSDGVEIQQGAISIKNGGSESYVRFYCEASNAHYTQLQASPHSAYSGNVTVVLPAAATNLVGDDTTNTLTNKTLTSAQVNTAILPASADGATLGSATKEFSDLFLADGGTIQFGNDQEITLTHVADSGLTLKHAATADDKFPTLTLAAGDTDIAASDKLGVINFQAPDEGTGTDAILVAAGIEAVSEGDFAADSNATKLSFKTAASAAAAETMSLSSAGVLTTSSNIVSGGNVVIADAGNIGSASDTDAIAISSGGVVTFSQKPVSNSGIAIDNITIDGTEIDLSSGDLTIDVAGDIILDSDDGRIDFKDNGTEIGLFQNSSSDFKIESRVSDKDIILAGNDGGTGITALTLDMSAAGAATFNNNVTAFSDERLKSDITTLKSSLEKVLQMRGVSYIRKDNVEGGEQIGVIAQEVENFYPQVVLTADDEQGTKSVDYGRLTAVLIEAVKELSELVNRDIASIKKDIDAICQHPLWQENQMKGE